MNGELHIILKFRNLEIGEQFFLIMEKILFENSVDIIWRFLKNLNCLIGIINSDSYLSFKFQNYKVDLKIKTRIICNF